MPHGGRREGSGRKPKLPPANLEAEIERMSELGMSLKSIAHYLGVSDGRFHEWLKETDARIIHQQARARTERKLAEQIYAEAIHNKKWYAVLHLDNKLEKRVQQEVDEEVHNTNSVGFVPAELTPEQKAEHEEMMREVEEQTKIELKRLMLERAIKASPEGSGND